MNYRKKTTTCYILKLKVLYYIKLVLRSYEFTRRFCAAYIQAKRNLRHAFYLRNIYVKEKSLSLIIIKLYKYSPFLCE